MKNRLRRLFMLAVFASAGLLCLQVYWIAREWSRSKDILQREVDYAFQQAIEREWNRRKDTLESYLSYFLHDTSFIKIQARYNEKQSTWMVQMFDPKQPKDYFSWSNPRLGLSGPVTEAQKEAIINAFIRDNVKKSIATDVVFYYTQRFGKIWMERYSSLKMDTAMASRFFLEELSKNEISAKYGIFYADTTRHQALPVNDRRSLLTKKIQVNYQQVNDPDKKYLAQAKLSQPETVLLKRMWLMAAGSLLLLGLTFFSLYRMYRTIIRQKQLDEMKDDFISNMTHELKTPIATVTAAVDGLQYYDALSDKQRTDRYLDTSRKELKRLDEMVSKVLELSTDERGLTQLRKERFFLKEFLEQVLSSFSVQSDLKWSFNIDDELKINGDRQQLLSVFQNLIENAIKHGKGNTVLNIAAQEEKGSVKIVFTDNGPGVETSFLPFIFNKFYRVPSTHQKVKGFGLGLFQVRSIVLAHGGEIKADNEKGLRFIISLPA